MSDERVVLDLSASDYKNVLFMCGVATRWVAQYMPDDLEQFLETFNRMNAGRESFTQYNVAELAKILREATRDSVSRVDEQINYHEQQQDAEQQQTNPEENLR